MAAIAGIQTFGEDAIESKPIVVQNSRYFRYADSLFCCVATQ